MMQGRTKKILGSKSSLRVLYLLNLTSVSLLREKICQENSVEREVMEDCKVKFIECLPITSAKKLNFKVTRLYVYDSRVVVY